MNVALPVDRAEVASLALGQAWRVHLATLTIAASAILLLFASDAIELVDIWLRSQSFNHCALILPVIAWLVWQRLPDLRRLQPRSWAPGLMIVALGAAVWLLGEAAMVSLGRHLGLVVMLQGTVIACLGKSASRGLAFPIFYAFFLVPAGEQLVPPLQTITAHISMFLLGFSGIPAHLDGVFIMTPTGLFEVAEACSGVQFLIAMMAYGALVANVCFRSARRRILFLAASVLIPILANGVRAWATIFIAAHTSIEFAAGFDHVIFGWIFFAIVIALLMAAGWPFVDRAAGERWFDPATLAEPSRGRSRVWQVGSAAVGLALLPLGWSASVAAGAAEAPAGIILPEVPGWTRIPSTSGRQWQPHFVGADLIRMGRYRNEAGQQVDLAIVWFARQQEGRELVGYGQGAVAPEGAWAWTSNGPPLPGGRLDRIISFGTLREVAIFYRVGNLLTGSPAAVRIETMKTRFVGGPQRAVALLVSAEAPADGVSPRPVIDAFLQALGPVEAVIDRAQIRTSGGRSSS